MFKGIVKLSKNGKGSLLVSEDLSFKLSRKELFKVFPGDKVECSVQQDKATIQKIIERNTTEVIGKLKKTNNNFKMFKQKIILLVLACFFLNTC